MYSLFRNLPHTVALAIMVIAPNFAWAKPAPNILFIVSDDHGWGDLPSNWDKTEARLPNLDALANQGVRFQNYHTVPLCGPSRACMFTGQYSSENGMWRGPGSQPLGSPGYRGIKRDVKMLSEHLLKAGYKTGAFGKWHMGSLDGEVPNNRGFEEFRGFLAGAHPYWITEKRSKIMHNRKADSTSKGHATELFTRWAEQFIRKSSAQDTPFFCYLAYNAVHGPLRTDKSKPASAPKEWVDKALARGVDFLRSDYVAILEHMDHNIGKLISVLNELGIADNTLIVFVSDNGGCTMEEGAAGGRFPGNNGPFRGAKGTTYQGGLNVPLLMKWKGRLPQGMVSKEQVMHCDIYSTLLDAVGIPVPKMNGRNPVRGISLMPHMLSGGKKIVAERSMLFELWGNVGLRKGNYKIWADVGRDSSPDWKALVSVLKEADLALFDLGKDSAEKNDLRTELPEVYDSLKKELINHFAKVNDEYPTKATHPDLFVGVKKGAGATNQDTLKKTKSVPPKALIASHGGRRKAFVAMDQNGDGKVTQGELDAWFKNRAIKSPGKFTYKPSQSKGALKKRDKNKDGMLSLEEWVNASAQER